MKVKPRPRPGRARIRLPVTPFLETLLAGDRAGALALSADALALVGSRVALVSDLIQPAQYQIGELWYEGRIGVAEEHRATAIVQAVVNSLPPTPSSDPVPQGSRCLMATAGEEQHVLGLKVLALAFEDEGWNVKSAGAGASLDEVLEAVRSWHPQVVALSASYLPSAKPVKQAIERIKATGPKVMVGGAAFNRVPGLWSRLGADGHGSDARIALVLARRMLPS
jgi:MerR family transcriptional regulator, light-induced transcriptional regulator